MRFIKKRIGYNHKNWQGRKNNIKFTIATHDNSYYVVLSHNKINHTFNTLWDSSISLPSFEDAVKYCEKYKVKGINTSKN